MTAALRASLAEQLELLLGGPPPPAYVDALLERVDAGDGTELLRVRPRSFDDVREAQALLGPGRPAPYWASAWPAGYALLRAVTAAPPRGRVLELGCGLGMPSVAAAKAGAEVLATDAAPEAVVYAAHNLAINDARGDVAVADFADLPPLGPFDVVMGADVLYTTANAEALARLLPALVGPGGLVLIADPGRAGCRAFLALTHRTWERTSTPDGPDVEVHRLTARRASA